MPKFKISGAQSDVLVWAGIALGGSLCVYLLARFAFPSLLKSVENIPAQTVTALGTSADNTANAAFPASGAGGGVIGALIDPFGLWTKAYDYVTGTETVSMTGTPITIPVAPPDDPVTDFGVFPNQRNW